MALAIQSTGGYLTRNGALSFTSDITYLGAFLFTGASQNFGAGGVLGSIPIAWTLWNDGTTHTTLGINQESPNNQNGNGANVLWLFGRNSSDVDQDDVFTGNGDYYNQWIHFAVTYQASGQVCKIYLIKEGFNASSPSFLISTTIFGTLLNNANAIDFWNEADVIPESIANNCAHGRFIAAPFVATQAEVLAQFASRSPTAAFSGHGSYTLFKFDDAANPQVDSGTTASNATKNTTQGNFVAFAGQPLEWRVAQSVTAPRRPPGVPPRAPLPGIARLGLGILAATQPQQNSNTITGSAAASSFAVAGSGSLTFDDTGSAAMSSFAALGPATFALPAPMAQPQPRTLGFATRFPAPPTPQIGFGILSPSNVAPQGAGLAAFSPFALSASALETFSATGSAALSSFAVTASGALAFAATGSAALSPFADSAAGAETFDSTGSAAPQAFAVLGFGTGAGATSYQPSPQPLAFGFPSRLRAPLPVGLGSRILQAGATSAVSGTGSAATSSFAVSGAGVLSFDGSGSAAMSSYALAGTGAEAFSGSGSAAAAPFAASGSGAEAFASSGSAAISPFAISGSSTESFDGAGSTALSTFTIAALGVFAIPGPMARPQPRAVGFPSRIGPPAGILGRGILATPTGSLPNVANVALYSFDVSGSGLLQFAATGSVAISSFAVAAIGTEAMVGAGSAASAPFAATAAGAESFASSGSAACQPFNSSGSGTQGTGFGGSASAALQPFAASGNGTEAFAGACSAATSPFGSSGSASGLLAITGSATCATSRFASSGSAAQALPITGSGSAALQPFACSGRQAIDFELAATLYCSREVDLTDDAATARWVTKV